MASGVQVDNSVTVLFEEMRLKKSGKKAAFFGFSPDEKFIVVQEGKEILSCERSNFFQRLKALLPENNCCYILMDLEYVTGESKKQDLVFVMWCPEEAPIKKKLLYASSKSYMKQALPGVTKHWEMHNKEDFIVEQIAKKLSSGKVKSLEGCNV
ncbi:destrin [Engystomops pustulosus]|uniref:destrin n=1 Tax=Engystomops pustulosus TaxID=76066 RepID=UPI003AFAD341